MFNGHAVFYFETSFIFCAFIVSHLLPSSSALGSLVWLSLETCCGTSARMAALALGIISQCNRQHMGKASLQAVSARMRL